MAVQVASYPPLSQLEWCNRRLEALRTERTSFMGHWRDLTDFLQPRRGRYTITDRNKGDKRNSKIINSKGTLALRTAASGIMANLTSPARPWLRLETPDPALMEYEPVKEWLQAVERLIYAVFSGSNLYQALPVLYTELLQFGTGAMSQIDDYEDVARFYSHTIGSYMITQNDRMVVDVLYREYELTVDQVAKKYGLEGATPFVRSAYDNGNYSYWVPLVQAIEPNPDFNPNSRLARHMEYRSLVYESGANRIQPAQGFLSRKGYHEFPAFCPRWEVTGEDIYGTNCPGMTALGDVKQLQVEERRKAMAIDKLVNPPLKGPGSLKNLNINALPGGTNLYDGDTTREGLQPVYQVDPRIQELMQDIQAVERRIDECFYVPLFMTFAQMEGIQPRNQLEIMQRNEEKLLMLGPVIERLFNELLDPLVDRTFNQIMRAGLLPPAPPELQDQTLKIKYISSLAQAQQAVGAGTIERVAGFVGQMAQLDPTVGAKFNAHEAIDQYASMIGAPAKLIRPDEQAQAIIQGLQQQQQMQAMPDMAQKGANAAAQGAQAIKTLSDIPPDQVKQAAGNMPAGIPMGGQQ